MEHWNGLTGITVAWIIFNALAIAAAQIWLWRSTLPKHGDDILEHDPIPTPADELAHIEQPRSTNQEEAIHHVVR